MTPRQIVSELDKHIVGQDNAKRAVAIALRSATGSRAASMTGAGVGIAFGAGSSGTTGAFASIVFCAAGAVGAAGSSGSTGAGAFTSIGSCSSGFTTDGGSLDRVHIFSPHRSHALQPLSTIWLREASVTLTSL